MTQSTNHYIQLIWYKAICELRAESSRSYLGFLWWFLEPLIYMGIFYLVFATGLRGRGLDFAPFLLAGLVPWKWFASSVNTCGRALNKNKGLILQVYLPKIILPVVQITVNSIKFVIILGMLVGFLAVFGYSPGVTWACLPLLILVQLTLISAAAITAAAIVPMLPDMKMLIENAILLMFFVTGIFFDINEMPAPWDQLLYINPMAVMVDSYRSVFLHNEWPDWNAILIVFSVSVVWVSGATWLIQKYDRYYPRVVS